MLKKKTKKKSTVKAGTHAKSKVWNGVKYKSGLEVFCAQQLAAAGLSAEYEGWKVKLQASFKCPLESWEFKKKTKTREASYDQVTQTVLGMTYSPDFPNVEAGWIIETKGYRTPDFDLKWKLFKKYLLDNNIQVRLYMPNNQQQVLATIAHIKANTNECSTTKIS